MLKIKNKIGFSLIEILVATVLFTIITTAALNIFKMVIESQRSAIATQNVEESLKYFLEVTGKEVRMAKRNGGLCLFASNGIYNIGANAIDDTLFFRNYHDQCVTYSLVMDNGVKRFAITRGNLMAFITPAKIYIDELNFVLRAETNTSQPAVTMELVAHALGKDSAKSEMKIQTTLTSRYYLIN